MTRALWLALLAGCGSAKAQDMERIPERVMNAPMVARAIDSTHRVVCYVFPNGSGSCVQF